jgi:hypothetical protein
MTQWHGGKGSGSRPLSVTQEEYANRWDLIFGRDKHKIEEQEPVEDEDTEDLDEDTEHDCESEE